MMKILAALFILEILKRAKKMKPDKIEIEDAETGRKIIIENNSK